MVRMTTCRALMRSRLASSSAGQPAMNICSRGGRVSIRSYRAVIARRSGESCLARSASSPVLCDGAVPEASAKAAAKVSCMTTIAPGNSNGCGPACSSIIFFSVFPVPLSAARTGPASASS